ncbi:MAG: 50S ribosomal protein L6 [Nitrososphaerota archaeon]|nr:50S ribosomal protein L6 [Nitrososphaerota archaeon]
MALKEYVEEVAIPDGVEVHVEPPAKIKVKGRLGELEKDFSHAAVNLELDSGKILVKFLGKGRKAEAMIGMITSLIKNMVIGVSRGFTYKLKVVASHFPISVKVKGDAVLIENFIGEKFPRVAKIVGNGTKVQVKGEDVIVMGIDKEAVGQTAANIEKATRIREKDLRKFLDGIYLYEKKEGWE